jgi:hypothetical protein
MTDLKSYNLNSVVGTASIPIFRSYYLFSRAACGRAKVVKTSHYHDSRLQTQNDFGFVFKLVDTVPSIGRTRILGPTIDTT